MQFAEDVERARRVAAELLTAWQSEGVFGRRDMPEDALPARVDHGSEEHLRFITLTVAIDYMRDADALWRSSRQTFADPETSWIYDPGAVAAIGSGQVIDAMRVHGLAKKPVQDAQTWQAVCTTLARQALTIRTPLVRLTKAEIVRLAGRLGAPLHLTHSCYMGTDPACGRCDACLLRLKGFREAGVEDPVAYV